MPIIKCARCRTEMDVRDTVINRSVPATEYNDCFVEGLIDYGCSDLAFDCECANPECRAYIRLKVGCKFIGFTMDTEDGEDIPVSD